PASRESAVDGPSAPPAASLTSPTAGHPPKHRVAGDSCDQRRVHHLPGVAVAGELAAEAVAVDEADHAAGGGGAQARWGACSTSPVPARAASSGEESDRP